MLKPLNRQHMYIQELFKKMKNNEDNKSYFKGILNRILKQSFTITEMYNGNSCLCNNRDYKALTRGTQYVIIEYHSSISKIETMYVGIKGNRKNEGMFFLDELNPYGYVSTRDYSIYPSSTFYMITI